MQKRPASETRRARLDQLEEMAPRLALARTPTPFAPLLRMGDRLGIPLWIKRDDLTDAEAGGNKLRKLEFLVADARARGATLLLTAGAAQSNHCRATAVVGARFGLRTRLVLRTDDPETPPADEGNLLLARLAGAEITWVDPAAYVSRDAILTGEASAARRRGEIPYTIPAGGSNALGALGYVRMAFELAAQMEALGLQGRHTLVVPCGTAGTAAGLLLGLRLLESEGTLLAVSVGASAVTLRDDIERICQDAASAYGLPAADASPARLRIVDEFVGSGYGKPSRQELRLIGELARCEGVILDPVYTGRAFFALAVVAKRERERLDMPVVFVHTGGLLGLFARSRELAQELPGSGDPTQARSVP